MKELPNRKKCYYCGFTERNNPNPENCLKLGTVLFERYIIGRILGSGGFGITYIAYDMELKCRMAIKEYFPKAIASRSTRDSSIRPNYKEDQVRYKDLLLKAYDEGQNMAKFHEDPGFVHVQDVRKANNTVYIIMFYIEGETLESYVVRNDNRLNYEEAFEIMSVVIQSLSRLHKKMIIHRDVTPDNIYITDSKQVKLLDFGSIKELYIDEPRSRELVGKPGYAPLEQYSQEGDIGCWMDEYSVASTFYRLLTGEVPKDSISRVESKALKRPRDFGAIIPTHAEKAIMKALSLGYDDRFCSMEDFLFALKGEGCKSTLNKWRWLLRTLRRIKL